MFPLRRVTDLTSCDVAFPIGHICRNDVEYSASRFEYPKTKSPIRVGVRHILFSFYQSFNLDAFCLAFKILACKGERISRWWESWLRKLMHSFRVGHNLLFVTEMPHPHLRSPLCGQDVHNISTIVRIQHARATRQTCGGAWA